MFSGIRPKSAKLRLLLFLEELLLFEISSVFDAFSAVAGFEPVNQLISSEAFMVNPGLRKIGDFPFLRSFESLFSFLALLPIERKK